MNPPNVFPARHRLRQLRVDAEALIFRALRYPEGHEFPHLVRSLLVTIAIFIQAEMNPTEDF